MYVLLPAMLGPVMICMRPALPIAPSVARKGNAKSDVVGNEFARGFQPIEYGMPSFADIEDRFLDDFRPAVVAPYGHDGQRGEHIQLRQDGGGRLQARGLHGDPLAQSGKELQLQ